MSRKKKLVIRSSILLLELILVIGLVRVFDEERGINKAAGFMQAKEIFMNTSEFELALWNTADTANKDAHDILIKWWYHQGEDKYYLFVPANLVQRGMHWLFSETANVWIEDELIVNGSLCELEEGNYEVKVESAKENKNYQMEIRYSSNIASLFLETESGSLAHIHEAKENYESGSYTLIAGMGNRYYTGDIEKIHGRGNVSWTDTDKKSYQIKLTEKQDFFGMGEDKHWLLIANAFDSTLLRNTLTFDIAKELNLSFTPDAEYVDVYANGEYLGNYLMVEKIEIGKNRVNIRNLEKQMETMNPDKPLEEYEFFMEQQGRLFSTKGYRIENQPKDITGGYLLEELVKNLDAAFTSQFFYKPEDSVSTKFFAGPAWDYDKAIAASGVTDEGIDLHDPNGLYAAVQTKDSDIWYALYHQDAFKELVVKIYQEELEPKVRGIAQNRVTMYAEYIMDSAMNDAIRWQVFAEETTVEGKAARYQEKVKELSDFLNLRLDFLNQEWSVQEQ